MAKSRTGSEISLPEPTTWARAVVLGTGILGVSLAERTLTAKNLDEFGRQVLDVVRGVAPSAQKLTTLLAARAGEIGLEADSDRLRTARSAHAFCEAIAGKTPREVVDTLAAARFETSSSAVQASLAAAAECIETLEDALVLGVLKQIAGRERYDLSASKYLREARLIIRQDEMRRSLAVELRMVAGAAQAYLLSGAPSAADGGGAGKDEAADSARPKSMVMASVVAPAAVRIESSRAAPPPSATRPKSTGSKRSMLAQTLTSEGVSSITRVSVERRGTVRDKQAARELIAEAVKEAEQQLEAAEGMVLISLTVTLDVSDKNS